MRIVDLRSDTITRPTPAMRKAMSLANVGDDVFGEDPTVNQLEEMSAERLGKPAALFVASGTMGNLICQLVHCNRGDEIILGDASHIFLNEQGGASALGGIHHRTVSNRDDGAMTIEDIEAAIRTDNIHFPRTRLIALENTHNFCHGSPLSAESMHAVMDLAHRHGLKVHVDGARIFNAAVALGMDARDLASNSDSIMFCLSKGLAAPVGSIVCGPQEFIQEARRIRKLVGGGMRQAGILAAAGIVALNEMVARLAEDHANAKKLGDGLAEMNGISIRADYVKTNILFFEVNRDGLSPQEFTKRLEAEGVRISAKDSRHLRAVTHYHVTSDDINYTLKIFSRVLGS